MKLAYFPNQTARNGEVVLQAIIDSAAYRGISVSPDDLNADVAVIWSVLWNGRLASNKTIYQHYRSLERNVVVVDIGALCRGYTWKISLNHITGEGYYGHQDDLDLDRPRFLGIQLGSNHNPRPEIVLAAQHTNSLQVQNVDLNSWLDNKISEMRQVTDRPLILRPHPRCRIDLQRFSRRGVAIQQPQPVAGTYDSFDFDTRYHAVVNYNSGPGIQAAIAGTRPVVDSSSLASPVSTTVADIELPYHCDRTQWLIEICHTEYTIQEIAQGRWIDRLHLV